MTDVSPIRILLVEDHALVRYAIGRTLRAEPGFIIAGECGTVDKAIERMTHTRVDIVLLDINLGSEQGGSLLTRMRSIEYKGKVLVVTAGVSEREATWLLQRGCSGIFLKHGSAGELTQRIRDIVAGRDKPDKAWAQAMLSQDRASDYATRRPFTLRESEVLRGVCRGLLNKEIAEQLGVSENTVKAFVRQLFQKTGVRTRAGLVTTAIELYWDQLDGLGLKARAAPESND
jgi:DNA-binding NarL/FixJ family response regulator